MKKLFLFIVCAVTAIAARAQFSGSGNGTENDPYLIYNPIQFSQMANFLNQDGVVFVLKNDLDLTEFISDNYPSEGWSPIGTNGAPFKGVLKGGNHKVSGLSINRSGVSYVGLFGYMQDATISNLYLEAGTISGGDYSALFAGYANNCSISNITASTSGVSGLNNMGGFIGRAVNVTLNNVSLQVGSNGVHGGQNVGGLVGQASGTFTNVNATTSVSGNSYVGGAVGLNFANITSCTIDGNVEGNSSHIGGIAGSSYTCILSGCIHFGDVEGAGRVGGICGNSEEAPIFADCKSQGDITSSDDYTGGVLGFGDFESMTNCSHFGNITGKNYVGGVYGGNLSQSQEDYPVYYKSSSSTKNNKNVTWTNTSNFEDGLVYIRKINKCCAIGDIIGKQNVGGIVGSHEAHRSFRFKSHGASDRSGSFGNPGSGYLWREGVYTSSNNYYYFSPVDYVDYTSLNVLSSYYSGNITGTINIGGLIGNKVCGEIQKCYAYANVVGEENVGGLFGCIKGLQGGEYGTITLKSSVAINTSVNASKSNAGRIYGYKADENAIIGALGTADGNLSLNKTSVVLSGVVQSVTDDLQNGTAIGQSMLKLKATYVAKGWNFDNDWQILDTECYPYMRYQAAPPVIESKVVSGSTSINGKSFDGGTVHLFYKDKPEQTYDCNSSNTWSFTTEALQSGAEVRLYAEKEGLTPSYYTTTTVGYPGSGSEADPYLIFSAEDLQGVSKQGYYKVMNDIDLTAWISENSPTKGWESIGRNGTEATYIDGDGHKISGLWIDTTEDYTGLFSNLSAGYIKNLTVEIASGKSVKGGNYTGGLIGRISNAEIQDCIVTGNVIGTGENVGGIAGYTNSTKLVGLEYKGTVQGTHSSTINIGGIAGCCIDGNVKKCLAESKIVTSSSANAGGLIGNASASMSTCSATTDVSVGGATSCVGGLVGRLPSGSVQTCFAGGTVQCTGSESYTAGLIGYAGEQSLQTVQNSYSTADVTGTLYSAGLVAYTFGTIDKCYASGNINGVRYGAGVVSMLDGTAAGVTNSVAANNTLTLSDQASWGCRVVGGYKNGCDEPNGSNYALKTMQVSLNGVPQKKYDDPIEGIAKTQEELQTSAFYQTLGWNVSDTWSISDGYPVFIVREEPKPITKLMFSKETLILKEGTSQDVVVSFQPSNATNKTLTWKTSNASIATVDNGTITAVAPGVATISATTTDGSNLTAKCTVTVVADLSSAIEDLRTLVEEAQYLYNNSVEGDNAGEYQAGARAELLSTINTVNAMISDSMEEEQINNGTSLINAAISLFKSKKNAPGADTDISSLDNTIYIEHQEGTAGQSLTLSVKMKNSTITATGYQFNIYLPDGATFALDEDDYPEVALSTARTTAIKTNYFDFSMQPDGSLMVLCNSTKGYAFSGTDGEVATIKINLSNDFEEGDYPIVLRNIEVTDATGTVFEDVDYFKSTLTVSTYTLGDANGDGRISVADFSSIASYILGNEVPGFIVKAADVNGDGFVKVSDLSAVANMILNGVSVSAPARPAMMAMSASPTLTSPDDYENVIYVEETNVAPGENTISIKMKNETIAATGYQFNIYLPDGMSFATDEDDMPLVNLSTARTTLTKTNYFDFAMQPDGSLMILCNSTKGETFSGTDGEVATIKINVSEDIASGEYPLILRNIEVTDATGTNYEDVSYMESTLIVGEETFEEGYSLQIIPFTMELDGDYEASVMMENITAVKNIVFDMVLPEGLYIDGEDGEYFVDLGSRVTTSSVRNQFQGTVEENPDGSMHVTAKFGRTTSSYVFTGNSGEALVFAMFADGLDEGIHEIELKNIVLNGELKVAPYKASVIVGEPKLSGSVVLQGNYTDETEDMLLLVAADADVSAIDMSGVIGIDPSLTIPVANENAVIYLPEGEEIANTKNVVIGNVCENLELTDGYSFSAPKAFTAEAVTYDAAVSSSLGYKTLVLPYDAEVPAGFEAYEVGTVEGSTLNMVQVLSITANKPVILKNAGTATLSASNVQIAVTGGASLTDGVLVGTYEAISAPVGSYVLQSQDGVSAFYKVTSDVQPVVGAFRAYLQVTAGASSIRVNFDESNGSQTGIENLKKQNADAVYYDLNGIRHSELQRGINVMKNDDGTKKCFVK